MDVAVTSSFLCSTALTRLSRVVHGRKRLETHSYMLLVCLSTPPAAEKPFRIRRYGSHEAQMEDGNACLYVTGHLKYDVKERKASLHVEWQPFRMPCPVIPCNFLCLFQSFRDAYPPLGRLEECSPGMGDEPVVNQESHTLRYHRRPADVRQWLARLSPFHSRPPRLISGKQVIPSGKGGLLGT